MKYLDSFSRHGLLVTLRNGTDLWVEPQELINEHLLGIARKHKDALIREIRDSSGSTDQPYPEIMPDYRFLWVATDLTSFEDNDPRYGYEVGRNPVYRMLDAPYYAWLRHQMENAKKAYDNGALSDDEYAILKDRFNVIHEWAVVHIGEEALRKAIRTTNIKRYAPPCNATIDAYYRTWAEAQKANKAKIYRGWEPAEAAKLADLLTTQGYAAIKSPIIDDIIIFVRDEEVALPSKWVGKVKFTLAELKLMIGLSVESVIQIYDVKDIFGGKVVPPDNQSINHISEIGDSNGLLAQTSSTIGVSEHSTLGIASGIQSCHYRTHKSDKLRLDPNNQPPEKQQILALF